MPAGYLDRLAVSSLSVDLGSSIQLCKGMFMMRFIVGFTLWCTSFLLVLGATSSYAGGKIQGKVSFQGKGLADASVLLYDVSGERVTGPADYQVEKTAIDGSFEIEVDSGQYFLLAKKNSGSSAAETLEMFAYYGGNPVVIGDDETINVGVNAAKIEPLDKPYKDGGTGIRGQVLIDGKPLARTRVTLYQDSTTIFRGIGYASVVTGDSGRFSFNLEPGEYYVIARKRMGKEKMGPLTDGDLFGFAHANPVKVEDGRYTIVHVNTSTKHIKVKEGGQDVTLGGTVKAGGTTISGVIMDNSGMPVANIFAAAYRDSMMTQKPDFISSPTGPDGVYTISLSEGGEYYIGARNTLGGPAEKGDLLGRYGGNEDHVVNLKTDEKLTNIDIVVELVE